MDIAHEAESGRDRDRDCEHDVRGDKWSNAQEDAGIKVLVVTYMTVGPSEAERSSFFSSRGAAWHIGPMYFPGVERGVLFRFATSAATSVSGW